MSYRRVMMFGGVGLLTLTCAVGGVRWKRLEKRRAELNSDYEKFLVEFRLYKEEELRYSVELREREKRTILLHETVDTLWKDRLERYKRTILDLYAYLKAMPEALGCLSGVTNRYRYMADNMRKFVGFDVSCCKLHNLALLLEHAHVFGLARVLETMQELFASEPLINAVCESVEQTVGISYPSTVAETSAAFTFCLETLDDAVSRCSSTFSSAIEASTPSPVSDGVRELVKMTHLSTLSRGQKALADKRLALARLLQREKRQLRTKEDVRSAVEYAERLQAYFANPPKGSPLSIIRREDKFTHAIRSDAEVKRALQQLELWRNTAAVFLLWQQAQDVLDCYQLVLAESLTNVNSTKP
ncbi:unnamed protein product [Phytomonas sp. EM1]|nr:unnamed protein product [Phytomonas sp. EM1]|eukprot:CCW65370.1 unnamed protein product [Phytomonas sp. isolate EM1]